MCNHVWQDTGMNWTYCIHCDSEGYHQAGDVIITKDKSDDWNRRRWRYRDDDAVDPVYNFDFNPNNVISSSTYEP